MHESEPDKVSGRNLYEYVTGMRNNSARTHRRKGIVRVKIFRYLQP